MSDLTSGEPRPLLLGSEWVTARPGGLNRYLAGLVDALSRADVAPHVIVLGPTPPSLMFHAVSEPGASLLSRVLAFRRHAAEMATTVDVVDAHFALYALLPITTTALRRVPLVVHFQGPWADESRIGRGEGRLVVALKRAVERAVYRRADIVIVLSAAFERLVCERYGVDPARVEVVPPGVDLTRFQPGHRTSVRAGLGLAPDAFVAVCVRRLDARMGLDVLLDAWVSVQAEHPDAVLLVAGEGRERTNLEERRNRLPHPNGCRLLGSVTDDQLVSLYQAANCSVVPSRELEGFGLVTLESAACGTPSIVTDVGGLADGVAGLDATLVILAGAPAILATRLLAAAAGDLPGRGATRVHAEKFSWDGVAHRHLTLYRRACDPRPVRVTYLGHTAQLSGGELALARLLPALGDIEPQVILAEDGPLVHRLRRDGVPVQVAPMARATRDLRRDRVRPGRLPVGAAAGALVGIWQLTRRLRSDRPDIVHTNTLKAALYGGIAGRLAGVPVVWHLRDRIAVDYLPSPAVRLVRLAARVLPTAVIGNSEATLAALGGRINHKCYDAVTPSSVESGTVDPGPHDRPFTVGQVGRLAPWKGQDLFLRAFALSFPDGDARARIVGAAMFGEDDWAQSLEKLAAALGIEERVDFVGFTDDVNTEYARLDVFVHASVIPEPFGQVVFEAMAAGVPVVVPDTGGPGEIVTDHTDGLLYAMGDVEDLCERLRQLQANPQLRGRLGRAGQRRVEEFRPDKVALQVMEVYRKVLAKPGIGRRRHSRRTGRQGNHWPRVTGPE